MARWGGLSAPLTVLSSAGLLLLGAVIGAALSGGLLAGRGAPGGKGGGLAGDDPGGVNHVAMNGLVSTSDVGASSPFVTPPTPESPPMAPPAGAGVGVLSLPPTIRRLHINIGPNTSPLIPPADKDVAVLAVEAQLEVASHLREQVARRYPDRFFVIPAALAGEEAIGFGSLGVHNKKGQSSSLAPVTAPKKWAAADSGEDRIGRGVEFVPILSLGRLLGAVPAGVDIPLLKTDTQGFDYSVITSASRPTLRRVRTVVAEVYRKGHSAYDLPPGVSNDLDRDWVPHMTRMGYRLVNTSGQGSETDATFERLGPP